MKYLEAKRVVDNFTGGDPLAFTLVLSGAVDALDLFVRAAAAQQQRRAEMKTLPFNTLGQKLAADPMSDQIEVWILLPWDFVPELDWRSGLPITPPNRDDVYSRAEDVARRLTSRHNSRLVYLPAPHLPLFMNPQENTGLAAFLLAHCQALGARILSPDAFSLGTYLASGCPIAASALGDIADVIVSMASPAAPSACRLLVTDFDNVLWKGVVADDGLQAIACGPEGAGFRHFMYQTMLLTLKREGVLLAGVSRNSEADALAPLREGMTLVGESDFVVTLASYQPKSVQVRSLTSRLNLGLDAVVFIDDNPVELAEVAASLPQVTCLTFPASDDAVPAFFGNLRRLFARTVITAEDRDRTNLYRIRAEGLVPAVGQAADLRLFLEELQMQLTVHDRTPKEQQRALQLINKTNQFNINGRRLTELELSEIVRNGGRLYTASLVDRTGAHGEILSCLVSNQGVVEAFVLSCRVFQRRIEHAFLCWLASNGAPVAFRYAETSRNEPAQQFFRDAAFKMNAAGLLEFDAKLFLERHSADTALCGVETG